LVRNGLVLQSARHEPVGLDILIRNDTIEALQPPGTLDAADAEVMNAEKMLIHPGLINAHTHGHGALARAFGDRWSLELLLAAGPWISANRSLDDKYLSAALNGAEMVMKGCTSCYDLFLELPCPSLRGRRYARDSRADAGRSRSIRSRPRAVCGVAHRASATGRSHAPTDV
jgi:cytosine/adenosine deaminase-related metal-dependent hydrolase